MTTYEYKIKKEIKAWEKEMLKPPSYTGRLAKGLQNKMNHIIPDKVHAVVTETIKRMVQLVIFGSEFTSNKPLKACRFEDREKKVYEKIKQYKTLAVASGWGTGSGGILLGLADFPILISIKMKLLFEIASLYGYDVREYKERLFILHIFQLAFSNQLRRRDLYQKVKNWDEYSKTLPYNRDEFDWRTFQQEYRDYIDLAKMLQLLPGVGAVVGAYANNKLMKVLGSTAIQAYRLRMYKKLEL